MRTYNATATLNDNGKLTIELPEEFHETYRQVEIVIKQNEANYDPERLRQWLAGFAGSMKGPVVDESSFDRGEIYDRSSP